MPNSWAHKMLDDLRPDFYGELTFSIHAGEITKVAKVQTLIAPTILAQRAMADSKRKLLTTPPHQEHVKHD